MSSKIEMPESLAQILKLMGKTNKEKLSKFSLEINL